MAFLGRSKKCDLVTLALELGEPASGNMTAVELIAVIKKSTSFEPELAKEMLEAIKETRLEKEQSEERKRQEEIEERERKRQEEIEERKRREDFERQRMIFEEAERQRQYELERMRIGTNRQRSGETTSNDGMINQRNVFSLYNIMQKFNPKDDDISLFLVIFERQAKRANIIKENWVTQLLPLLPHDIIQLIAREPEERSEDYDYIKDILLKRFKLSPEKFRVKFTQHQRKSDSTWKDFTFELNNYFEEWIQGLDINDFVSLKDLMVTDQLKKRVPSEVREHFIDSWTDITSSAKLSELLDKYEDVRGQRKRLDTYSDNERRKPLDTEDNATRRKPQESMKFSRNEGRIRNQDYGSSNYERYDRRRPLQCYECGSLEHLRPQCPKLNSQTGVKQVNRISNVLEDDSLLSPFTSLAIVNGFTLPVLRDSGATIDLICQKFVKPCMYTGEKVWVQQPLDERCTCLPLAKVAISGSFGNIVTKAAVVPDKFDRGHYLLGNETAAHIASLPKTFSLGDKPIFNGSTTERNSGKRIVRNLLSPELNHIHNTESKVATNNIGLRESYVTYKNDSLCDSDQAADDAKLKNCKEGNSMILPEQMRETAVKTSPNFDTENRISLTTTSLMCKHMGNQEDISLNDKKSVFTKKKLILQEEYLKLQEENIRLHKKYLSFQKKWISVHGELIPEMKVEKEISAKTNEATSIVARPKIQTDAGKSNELLCRKDRNSRNENHCELQTKAISPNDSQAETLRSNLSSYLSRRDPTENDILKGKFKKKHQRTKITMK